VFVREEVGSAPTAISPACLCWSWRACASAGKLKELGNSILGNFGMSLDNFKAVQDPATGS